MRQLALDLIARAEPSLDNFVEGPNRELLSVLRAVAAGPHLPPRVHLWGEPGCGKTHLLRALAAKPLGPASAPQEFASGTGDAVVAVDDCELLDDTQQIALFALFNRAAADPTIRIVTASRQAPLGLTDLRPELRTRLGSGLVIAVQPLSDEDKERALRDAAQASGVQCSDDLYRYLLTRKSRDLRSLLAWFAALDRFSLERKRPLSAALAREFDSLGESAAVGQQ